jgi:hypothetical protein
MSEKVIPEIAVVGIEYRQERIACDRPGSPRSGVAAAEVVAQPG